LDRDQDSDGILTPRGRRAVRRIVIGIGATILTFGLALCGLWLLPAANDPHGGGFLGLFALVLIPAGAAILAAAWAARPRPSGREDL